MQKHGCNDVMLVDAREAARLLSVSPRKLWGMTASGAIPHVRLGRCLRYPVDDLRLWIESQKIGGADNA